MLAKIITLVTGCVTFLGGFLVVWGAVQLGRSIGNRGGGGEGMEAGIATIAGGADHHRRRGLLRPARHLMDAGLGGPG